jgi:hypothetical protein
VVEKEVIVEKIVEVLVFKDTEETLRINEELKINNIKLQNQIKKLEEKITQQQDLHNATFDLSKSELVNSQMANNSNSNLN